MKKLSKVDLKKLIIALVLFLICITVIYFIMSNAFRKREFRQRVSDYLDYQLAGEVDKALDMIHFEPRNSHMTEKYKDDLYENGPDYNDYRIVDAKRVTKDLYQVYVDLIDEQFEYHWYPVFFFMDGIWYMAFDVYELPEQFAADSGKLMIDPDVLPPSSVIIGGEG